MQHDVVVCNTIHLGLFLGVFVFILLVTKNWTIHMQIGKAFRRGQFYTSQKNVLHYETDGVFSCRRKVALIYSSSVGTWNLERHISGGMLAHPMYTASPSSMVIPWVVIAAALSLRTSASMCPIINGRRQKRI